MKTEKSTLVAMIIITTLKRLLKAISNLTEDWISTAKAYKNYLSHLAAFKRQHEIYESADTIQRSVWLFSIMLLIPMLAIIDFATLRLFFEYLGSKVEEGGVKTFLSQYGFLIFISLEMSVAVFYLYNRKKREEGEGGLGITIVIVAVMCLIALFPAFLIAAGFYLNQANSGADFVKVCALIVFSILVHAFIFIFSEILWNAIGFTWYLTKSFWFDITNPKEKLLKLTPRLRKLYLEYKHHLDEFQALPANEQKNFDPTLGKRETWLMEKLNGFNDDDFEIDIITAAPVEPAPDKSAGVAATTHQSQSQGKIGFQYTNRI